MCPQITTLPTFRGLPVRVFSNNCIGYTVDELHDFGVGDCCPVVEGPADTSAPTASTLPTADPSCTLWRYPRLDPEGTGAIFLDVAANTYDYVTYDGTKWTKSVALTAISATIYDSVGAPSRWSAGAHVIARNMTTGGFDEFVQTNGVWSAAQPITTLMFTGSTKTGASLTPDALRMVFEGIEAFTGLTHVYYADRPTPTSAFSAARVLPFPGAPPQAFEPFLTEDCGTLYYGDSDGTIWAARQ